MALPYVENFPGAGALPAGWGAVTGASSVFTQSGGEAACGSEPSVSIWNTDIPNADQYVKWLIGNTREDQASYGVGGGIRGASGGNSGFFVKTNTNAAGEIELWEGCVSPNSVGSPYTAGTAPAVDDEMELRGVGTLITVKHLGNTRISVSNASWASGKGFMWGAPNSVFGTIERIEIGNNVSAPPPRASEEDRIPIIHQLAFMGAI